MSADRSDQPAGPPTARTGAVAALSLVVAVVLGDSGVVTLALPEILRDFGAEVGEVAWVLIAFNLVLALVAVPAARVCVRGDPAAATAGGLVGFAAATAVCAVAPSLGVLIAARAAQAVGGALVIVGSLELLVEATGAERAGARRWAAAGVAGAALGPVIGGLLTSAFSWRSIFVVQIPVVLLALPAAIALRGRVVRRRASLDTSPDRPHVMANLALALLSAALTAALFLLVLLLVEGWRRSPAVAAVAVTAVPVAALAAGPLFRRVRAGTRSEAIAGSVLIAGGLTGLALLPGAELAWTIAPQVLVGLGLGLSVDSLTAAALRDRIPRALHGGWTIAARHAGVVAGLAILTPIFTADLRHAETPAKEAVASLVLDAPLPASTKLDLADGLGRQLVAERGRVPDLRPAFATLAAAGAAGGHRRGPGARPRGSARARRDPRVPHRLPRRGGAGAAGAGARAGAARPEPTMRALALPLIAVLLVAAVLGAQVAAGGGDYVPRRPADPCAPRAVPPIPAQLEPVAERIVLLGLDSAACRLGVSRERLVLALADTRSLDPDAPAALKAGLRDAVDRLDREGRLPKVSQLLPEALDQADLPGIVKTVIARDPGRDRRQRPPDRAAAAPGRRRARRRPARP